MSVISSGVSQLALSSMNMGNGKLLSREACMRVTAAVDRRVCEHVRAVVTSRMRLKDNEANLVRCKISVSPALSKGAPIPVTRNAVCHR